MPWLFFFAALALPAWYAVGLLAHPRASFVVADFWRFIVVHLWVEDFLELFTTVMVAYMFVLLGVVRERIALTVIFVDIVLYSAGGAISRCAPMMSPAPSLRRSFSSGLSGVTSHSPQPAGRQA